MRLIKVDGMISRLRIRQWLDAFFIRGQALLHLAHCAEQFIDRPSLFPAQLRDGFHEVARGVERVRVAVLGEQAICLHTISILLTRCHNPVQLRIRLLEEDFIELLADERMGPFHGLEIAGAHGMGRDHPIELQCCALRLHGPNRLEHLLDSAPNVVNFHVEFGPPWDELLLVGDRRQVHLMHFDPLDMMLLSFSAGTSRHADWHTHVRCHVCCHSLCPRISLSITHREWTGRRKRGSHADWSRRRRGPDIKVHRWRVCRLLLLLWLLLLLLLLLLFLCYNAGALTNQLLNLVHSFSELEKLLRCFSRCRAY